MQARPKWMTTVAGLGAIVLLVASFTSSAPRWVEGRLAEGVGGHPETVEADVTPAAAQRAASVSLPAECAPTDNPPPTEYGFVAKATKGSVEGGVMKIEGLTGRICGIIRLVSSTIPGCPVVGKLIVPSAGVMFRDDLTTTLTVVPDMRPEVPTTVDMARIEQPIDCGASSEDGLKVDLDLAAHGRAGAFGLECAIPFSGTARIRITGDPFGGTGKFTLRGDQFSAGSVSNNDKYCPGELPGHVDRIAQLPGKNYTVKISGKLAIYQS